MQILIIFLWKPCGAEAMRKDHQRPFALLRDLGVLDRRAEHLAVQQAPHVRAADVDHRSKDGDLVDEEELSSGRPARPLGQDGLHELHHPDQVLVLRPEGPTLVLVDRLIEGEVGGIEEAKESAIFNAPRCHEVLITHCVWTCG